ncbi:metal-dependent hydrolase [Megalodesulfovibrio gigas]|uniref:UPF0173 metal-dependent hydrolase DGI_0607 n=1 Tax=Megalodesulfovibrio gigas (strain ATCC 19364 / DSM 1382 / NCIMB 9332 / VKM B-1759) TaxID=1121448 RepID=T2G7E5_MEGG1|nr:metal-dependent hydrolase [Megalodesulfovibrio gigas]AGW12515.1 putative beta-lactamase domain-containing protein [Megalodesulfovibrio gigas DSM 1382 = ATCC 19364]
MRTTLTWHGHSNFQIVDPAINICIDPFFEGNPSAGSTIESIAAPDLICVTHDHGDHIGQTVELARASGCMVAAVVETAGKLMHLGVPQAQIVNGIGFNLGGTMVVKGAAITMVQACHTSESGVPVGYIITLPDGFTLYHAGDTAIFAEMALWGQLYAIDVACLPIGGVFTMDPRQAAHACKLLQCDRVVPMHWGTFPVLEKNTRAFARHLAEIAPDTALMEMAPGETVVLEKNPDTCGCHDG